MRPVATSRAWAVLGTLALGACSGAGPGGDGGTGGGGGLLPPPHVLLSVDQAQVIGPLVTGTVDVTGCDAVSRVQLTESGAFLVDLAFGPGPTRFALDPSQLSGVWPRTGFAAALTLGATARCADGRSNTAAGVPVTFFPVTSRFSLTDGGGQVVPDQFLAQGGAGGQAVSFLGCVGTEAGGTALARVDERGQVLATSDALPVPCTAATQLSELTPSGLRWVLEPGQGAYLLRADLTVARQLTGVVRRLGMSTASGAAVLWNDALLSPRLQKLDATGGAGDWLVEWAGALNADPLVDAARGVAWVSDWEFTPGGDHGDVVAWELDLAAPRLLNPASPGATTPPVLLRVPVAQDVSLPPVPAAAFSPDGGVLYVATVAGTPARTTVQACDTGTGGCQGAGRRWASAPLPGTVSALVPVAGGELVVAAGPTGTWFLWGADGGVANRGGQPIAPSGSLLVLGLQPGAGRAVYLLHGPAGGFPTELVAVDAPGSGELYRVGFGSGQSAADGLTVGVDGSGQAWLRVGPDLVRPWPLATYRALLGR